MSIKISELPAATAINAADVLCIVQDAATKQAAVSLLPQPSSFLPGMIQLYAGSAAPTGWLLCDGAAVSRTTYAALFAVISTTYGAPDANTFKLPDLRGRAPLGAGAGAGLTARTLGATGGEEKHTLIDAEASSGTLLVLNGGGVLIPTLEGVYALPRGGGLPHNTMMPFTTINFIIKT